jgi:hypothetical protein
VPAVGPGVFTQYVGTGQSQLPPHLAHRQSGLARDPTFTQFGVAIPVDGSCSVTHKSLDGMPSAELKQTRAADAHANSSSSSNISVCHCGGEKSAKEL